KRNNFSHYLTNPIHFTDATNLQFTLPISTQGKIEIWNMNGQLVYQQQQMFEAGWQQVEIAQQFPVGIYLARFTSAIWIGETKLMVIAN
ncbi:MAG: T9SS type A sorting domain-containing protein, partial [Saprospiraceae bacterium]|nr:T9SS type A sorting domain-containing protein [Saprospiraceae bacterium]